MEKIDLYTMIKNGVATLPDVPELPVINLVVPPMVTPPDVPVTQPPAAVVINKEFPSLKPPYWNSFPKT